MGTKNPMAQAEAYDDNHTATSTNLSANKRESAPSTGVGCRPCSWLISFRYFLVIAGIIGGLIVIFATPRQCPSGYAEEDCVANGHDYPCKNGLSCSNKGPSSAATAGGIIIIIITSIIGCIQCCHQSRCILSDDHYNSKVCFCC